MWKSATEGEGGRKSEGNRRQSKVTREAGGRTRSDGRRKRERERMKGKMVSEVYRKKKDGDGDSVRENKRIHTVCNNIYCNPTI